MKSYTEEAFTTDPPVCLLKDLTVRILKDEDHRRAGQLLDQEHYLGDCPEGRQLLQIVEYRLRWYHTRTSVASGRKARFS